MTVFPLHNLRYRDAGSFANADAVVVASHFAAEHYRTKLRPAVHGSAEPR